MFILFQGTQAIIARLKFLRLFLQALTALAPIKSISPNEQEMNEIVRLLNGAGDLIPLMKRTICLGTQPDPNGESPLDFKQLGTFFKKMNRFRKRNRF